MCMHLATEQGSTSSQMGRKLKDLSADARGVQDIADVKAKMQQLVLLRDRVLFAPTAAAMIPDTPFAGALEEVASWLRRHGLVQYVPMFHAAAVTPQLCDILDERGWAELWATELMGVEQQDRVRLMQALPDLLNREHQLASSAAMPTFGSPSVHAPVFPAPASAMAVSSAGGSNAPAGTSFGSLASAKAAPASLNVRVLISAEPRGEFSPPGSEAPSSVVGCIHVPATISSFAEARHAVETQLAGKLPPSFVFLRHGAPVGRKQESRWQCELSPSSLDLFIRGKLADTPSQTPAANEAGRQSAFEQQASEETSATAFGAAAAPPDTTPASLDMFSGMEIAGSDFMAEMDAISAVAPPPVVADAFQAELEVTGGIKRGGKKKRKAKPPAKVEALASATASPTGLAMANGSTHPHSAPGPPPAPVFVAQADGYEEYRVDPADGYEYTRAEFIDAYGGTAEWDAAAPPESAAAVESTTVSAAAAAAAADRSSDMSVVELVRAAQESRLGRIAATETRLEAATNVAEQSERSVDPIRASVEAQMLRTAQLLAEKQEDTSTTSASTHDSTGSIYESTGSIYDTSAVDSAPASASSFDFMQSSQLEPEPEPEPQSSNIYDSLASGGAVTGEAAPSAFSFVTPSAPASEPESAASGSQSGASTGSIYDTSAVDSAPASASSFDFMQSSQLEPEPEPVREPLSNSTPAVAGGSLVAGDFDLSFMSQKPSVLTLDVSSSVESNVFAKPEPSSDSTTTPSPAHSAVSASSFDFINTTTAAAETETHNSSSSYAFDFISSTASDSEPSCIYDSVANGGTVSGEQAPAGRGSIYATAEPEPAALDDNRGSIKRVPDGQDHGVQAADPFDLSFMSHQAPLVTSSNSTVVRPHSGLSGISVTSSAASVSSFDFITPSAASSPSAEATTSSDLRASSQPPTSIYDSLFAQEDLELVEDATISTGGETSGFDFICSGSLTPGGTVQGTPGSLSGSIYDTAPAPAPATGGFTFVPNAELPDIDLKPVSIPDVSVVPAATASGGFSFIQSGGDLTPGGTVVASHIARAPAPSVLSIYDTPSVLAEERPAPVNPSVFNRRVGGAPQAMHEPQLMAPAPAPAAAGFLFSPGSWDLGSGEEKRTDPADGQMYTRQEFISQYGTAGVAHWEAASPT